MHHAFMIHDANEKLANLLGAVALVVHDALTEVDASDSRAAAILCIGNHPDDSIDDLRHILGLSHSGAVRLVDRLHREKMLIKTRTADDRRLTRLQLSEDGVREFERLLERRRQALSGLVDELPREVAASLVGPLEKLLAAKTSSLLDARRTCRLCAERDCRPTGCPVEIAAGSLS